MSGKKCKQCGSSEIEVDPGRGDAVCTNCGTVLEDNMIVAEVEFQETAHGGAAAIGQFVSAESKGGATGFGGAFNAGIGQESREITLRRARDGITALCQQLRLNQQCIDIACNFFKMALSRHLTIGRPSSHTQAACVYMTCRTEETPHLLIDISDALQICCYELGRTYFKLSRALCINIPPTDPCLYILRFASQLQFEEKKHEVSMTALRLVQRMKRDSIHYGRRPSGICGAALLIAARLHNFSRTPADVVRIVKVHETTLRKRLLEFGETPSSALTLEEFMTVDLEEEQDPPSFRAARKRDKERLQKLMDEEDGEKEVTELQREIDAQLEKDNCRKRKAATIGTPASFLACDENSMEEAEASRFAAEETLTLLGEIAKEVQSSSDPQQKPEKVKMEKGLGPDLLVIGLGQPDEKPTNFVKPEAKPQFGRDLHNEEELLLDDKDEEYISSIIMSEDEARHKTRMWNSINAGYLKDQKEKAERRAKENESKDKKKKVRGAYKKKTACNASTAGEAIEKMLAEKRFSMKINYDILRRIDQTCSPAESEVREIPAVAQSKLSTPSHDIVPSSPVPRKHKKKTGQTPTPVGKPPASPAPRTPATAAPATPSTPAPATPGTPAPATPANIDVDDDDEELEAEATSAGGEMSLAAMLQNNQDEDYYDEEEY